MSGQVRHVDVTSKDPHFDVPLLRKTRILQLCLRACDEGESSFCPWLPVKPFEPRYHLSEASGDQKTFDIDDDDFNLPYEIVTIHAAIHQKILESTILRGDSETNLGEIWNLLKLHQKHQTIIFKSIKNSQFLAQITSSRYPSSQFFWINRATFLFMLYERQSRKNPLCFWT